jgi:hypothetical protein
MPQSLAPRWPHCPICWLFFTATDKDVPRCTNRDHWRAAGLTPPEGFYPQLLGSPTRFTVLARKWWEPRLRCADHCADVHSAKATALARFQVRGTLEVAVYDGYACKRLYRHYRRLPADFQY